jgi:hypothetical protein
MPQNLLRQLSAPKRSESKFMPPTALRAIRLLARYAWRIALHPAVLLFEIKLTRTNVLLNGAQGNRDGNVRAPFSDMEPYGYTALKNSWDKCHRGCHLFS